MNPADTVSDPELDHPPLHDLASPAQFAWVVLPYAIYIDFVTNGSASLLLRRAGLPLDQVANAIALLGIPSFIYFLWSPVVDLGLRRRTWHFVSTLVSAAALLAGSLALEHHPSWAVWLYFAGLFFCMMISSAYGGLMAAMLTPSSRARGAAWAQASNLGGGAVATGLILWLALHLRASLWAPIAALLMVLPAVAALFLKEPARHHHPKLSEHPRAVLRELRATCLEPANFFGLLLLLAPPGAGALIGLLPAIASDYHVSGDSVVWINGVGGGLLMGLGCLAGTLVPAGIDRRIAYASAGAINAIPAFFLAFATPGYAVYMVGTVIYLFTIGLTSSVCMSLILDVVGAVRRGGSLRYSLLSSLQYLPIAYMTWLEGVASKHFGFRGIPGAEAVSCLFDLPLIAVWSLWYLRSRRRQTLAAA
ncbi:MFS transporter [Silvibacterium acidisoli]|uniref:MFS transporter n=1 Tax=Acidobacteriaceae bacterium ZG23-2 TaxID=2883246 RepID=UPI00406C80BD